ncbi:Cof-type HAD-IIB family hydrolase [Desulfovibrio inopinatus]|uniref:Cof-type HAD-IIB family hydrolase n=1 Tax=Desulfovibrio inopinatus TaxID=102109 RepID=UPI00040EF8C5|nr:Cof-type HAD-IIB family hydrolase [Desulfovibrio inopinatus]
MRHHTPRPIPALDDIKLLALDIDGTLVTRWNHIPKHVIATIRAVAEHGVKVMLASARPPISVRLIMEILGLHGYAVSLNGAIVLDDNTEVAIKHSLGEDNVRHVVASAKQSGVTTCLYSESAWYTEVINPVVEHEAIVVGAPPVMADAIEAHAAEAAKLLLVGEHDTLLPLQHQGRDLGLACEFSVPSFLEMTAPSATKGQGLAFVLDTLGIDRKHAIAIGDGHNDIGMLKLAGYSAALGNAPMDVRDHADIVLDTVYNGGVGHFLLRLLQNS